MWQLTAKHGKRKGKSWPITNDPLVIGRNPTCTVTLRDSLVSREHCRIELIDDNLYVEDLRSANSTFVNGQPISRSELTIGDELTAGDATFIVTRTSMNDPLTGTPNFNHTTQRIDLSALGLGSDHGRNESAPTVRELARLNAMTYAFSRCRDRDDIFRIVTENLSECFADTEWFIADSDDPRAIVTHPAGLMLSAETLRHIAQVSENGLDEGSVATHRSPDGRQTTTSLVPLRMGDRFVGVLGTNHRTRNDREFVFAKSVARLLAPFWFAVSSKRVRANTCTQASQAETTFLGESDAAVQARRLIAIGASANLPVLMQGETGTGKELAARLIHDLSDRPNGSFVTVNCAAIAEDLFESEMFGHTKGAYTGAANSRDGLLAEADGGHLFLDEIVDLSARNQSRFLRAIETGQFRPIGASRDRVTKFLTIAASNRDLLAAVETGEFRDDLYYRISAIEIFLPPLGDRRSDIPLLVEHFVDEFSSQRNVERVVFDDDALKFLETRPWRGNVRELRNAVGKIASFAQGPTVSRNFIEKILARPSNEARETSNRIEDVERAHIEQVLTQCGGKINDAASVLGMHRNTLSKKLKKYNVLH